MSAPLGRAPASQHELRVRAAMCATLKAAMETAHVSQAELGRLLGISKQAVNQGLTIRPWPLKRIEEMGALLGLSWELETRVCLRARDGRVVGEAMVCDASE